MRRELQVRLLRSWWTQQPRKKGDVLVELDPEPYRVQVAIKQAAVDSAQADLVAAQAAVRSLMAQARSQRFKLIHAIEDVDNQVALVRARAATWEQSKAAGARPSGV